MKYTNIEEVCELLEEIAPLSLQESYDNSGLLIGNKKDEVKGILLCLDVTLEIVEEAILLGYNLIISHHPLIFKGLKKINGNDLVERVVISAIRHNICIYSIHTNLDNVLKNGVNEKIACQLGLERITILLSKPQYKDVGSGAIGCLQEPMTTDHFLGFLADKMNTSVIKHTKIINKKVSIIAVCGGSGGFALKEAIAQKADVFISADFKYHDYFEANDQIMICDIGHYESEQFTICLLFDIITNKFSNFGVSKTKIITNPVTYFIK